VDCPVEVVRTAVGRPHLRGPADQPALGRNYQAGREGRAGVVDLDLVDLGAVGISRVDKVDAQLNCPLQDDRRVGPPGCGYGESAPCVSDKYPDSVGGLRHRLSLAARQIPRLKNVKIARRVFTAFSILFQPLYFMMLLMYVAELQQEEDTLALALDVGILLLSFNAAQLWALNKLGVLGAGSSS
jgi:hypothetical protein